MVWMSPSATRRETSGCPVLWRGSCTAYFFRMLDQVLDTALTSAALQGRAYKGAVPCVTPEGTDMPVEGDV